MWCRRIENSLEDSKELHRSETKQKKSFLQLRQSIMTSTSLNLETCKMNKLFYFKHNLQALVTSQEWAIKKTHSKREEYMVYWNIIHHGKGCGIIFMLLDSNLIQKQISPICQNHPCFFFIGYFMIIPTGIKKKQFLT